MNAVHEPLRQRPRRFGELRLSAFRVAERMAARLGGRSYYRRAHLAAGRFLVREERVAVPGLARELEGFSIAQISDLHCGAFLSRGDLAAVVDAVNALAPDLCALTGDFVTHRWEESLLALDDCARLAPRRGSYGVLGNHDYRGRCEGRIAEAYAARGIRILRNECARVAVGAGAVALVGLEDLEEAKRIDLDAARAGVRAGDVEIVLCHNPLGARRIARAGCAAILAGHTHGMQVDLPWLRTLGPAHPGLRLSIGATALIVSRGLGVVGLPLRWRAPAEVVLVRLTRAPEER
jgi:predicted MPP superfamily phosphohydrolase